MLLFEREGHYDFVSTPRGAVIRFLDTPAQLNYLFGHITHFNDYADDAQLQGILGRVIRFEPDFEKTLGFEKELYALRGEAFRRRVRPYSLYNFKTHVSLDKGNASMLRLDLIAILRESDLRTSKYFLE
jgi:hypothetical protein